VEELEALEKVVEEETPKNVRVSQCFSRLLLSSLLMVQVEE
jgi:hypothetical protein